MQTVGELDDNHADVLVHGHEHLADGCRLLVGEAFHLDAGDLGDTLDQLGDALAEQARDIAVGGFGVLNGVVKKRGAQGFDVHTQVGQNDGNLNRVSDERLAALAQLALVNLTCEGERLHELLFLVLGKVRLGHFLQDGETLFGSFALAAGTVTNLVVVFLKHVSARIGSDGGQARQILRVSHDDPLAFPRVRTAETERAPRLYVTRSLYRSSRTRRMPPARPPRSAS